MLGRLPTSYEFIRISASLYRAIRRRNL